MISSRRAGTPGLGATGRPGAANLAANIWGTGEREEGEQYVVEKEGDAKRLILNICQLQNNFKANWAGHLSICGKAATLIGPQHMLPPATAARGFI